MKLLAINPFTAVDITVFASTYTIRKEVPSQIACNFACKSFQPFI